MGVDLVHSATSVARRLHHCESSYSSCILNSIPCASRFLPSYTECTTVCPALAVALGGRMVVHHNHRH